MKKNTPKIICVLLSVIIIILSAVYMYIAYKKYTTEKRLLNIANAIVNQNVVNSIQNNCTEHEQSFDNDFKNQDDLIGKLIIPSIGVEAPIKDGTSSDVLKYAIGHFTGSSYWNGNVCLASHNRGTFAHYFEKINELSPGDEIIYQTKEGTRIYYVDSSNIIDETDVSVLNSTKNNYLTMITCVKNQPKSRLCVKAIEKNKEGE